MPEKSSVGQLGGSSGQYDGPDVCDTCEGYGEVCVGFGIWSHMRPGLARCPDCCGTGQEGQTDAEYDERDGHA